jgi:predicted DNA-binding transcriptional regulator AlpA
MNNTLETRVTPEAYSVLGFCQAFGISKSLFYKLCQEGRGPKKLKVGRRTLVSRLAATEWMAGLESIN